ncbi:MAG: hypothetical protein LC750_09150 [Actinobacteria bacterium]|nr:hypothetical protein [Actinomycetota bacterium]
MTIVRQIALVGKVLVVVPARYFCVVAVAAGVLVVDVMVATVTLVDVGAVLDVGIEVVTVVELPLKDPCISIVGAEPAAVTFR